MKKAIKHLFWIGFLLVLSCNQIALDKDEYIAYFKDRENGYLREVELGELTFSIQYRPYALIALQENRKIDPAAHRQRVKELEGTLNFVVKIKANQSDIPPLKYNISSMSEYNQRLSYFTTFAQKDFSIKYGDAVLSPTGYSFETNYGLTPEDAIVLQFTLPTNEPQLKHDLELSYNDRVFQNGIIKAKFQTKYLNNIPKLNV